MKEIEKLRAGLEYNFEDAEVNSTKPRAIKYCEMLNKTSLLKSKKREEITRKLLGSTKLNPCLMPVFNCENGLNISVGDNFFTNYNVTILDIAPVTIGDFVMIGPTVLITTVGHPLSPKGRKQRLAKASPINIGSNVWIGGNAVILPGVTIGDNVVIGAGAVVTKDIPSNSVAMGVPARIVKEIENDLIDTVKAD